MAHALIIDDNEMGIDVLDALLAGQGVTCTGVVNPTQIHSVINQLDELDVIFLDLEMPDINGYEVLEILRDELDITVPIVAYSVHSAEINTVRELGFDGYLAKPLRRENFPNQLKKILNGQAVWAVD